MVLPCVFVSQSRSRSNANGSGTGTISIYLYNDEYNDETNDTTWDHAVSFTGSNKYAGQNQNSPNYNPLRMSGISSNSDINEGTVNINTHTSNHSSARPWMFGLVFKHDGGGTNQTVFGQCEGNDSSHDNIMITLDANNNCFFQWGRESDGYNKKFLGNIPSHTWVAPVVVYKGQRWKSGSATGSNLADTFQFGWIDLATKNISYNFYANSNDINTSSWSTTGKDMGNQIAGDLVVGGRFNNRSFKGDVASVVVTTLLRDQLVPTDEELVTMITNPEGWLTNYKEGQSYRSSGFNFATSNFQRNNSGSSWSTQVWLMGDGVFDSYNNMIRNLVFPTDQNYTMLRLYNLQSTDIVSASIAGITLNSNVINFTGNIYDFGSNFYDSYLINITSTDDRDWETISVDCKLYNLSMV